MTRVLAIALLTQALLVLSGLATLQIVNFRQRISIAETIPWAYGVGAVLLFLGGGLLVKNEWLPHHWHWLVAGIMAALIAVGTIVYLRTQPKPGVESFGDFKFRWYDGLVIALILVKVSLVSYICMVNSVIDSDATYINGYMSLAKKIGAGAGYSEVMTRSAEAGSKFAVSPLSPSLLAAWVRLFLDRWHDSVVTLPWLFAWLFSSYIGFIVCWRLTRRLTASLICASLILSLPLVASHVIRSGFNDILVAYFFACSIGVLSFTFMVERKPDLVWLVAGIVAVLGAALCKSEGKMWALFLAVMWINYYLHEYKNVPWKKLIAVQAVLVVVLLAIHWLVLDADFFKLLEGPRGHLMATRTPEYIAFLSTVVIMFQDGSFNLAWWAVLAIGIYLLAAGGVSENIKMMVLFTFAIIFSVIYFANFTENIRYTVIGTNVSRFLIQVSGVIIPLYCGLVLTCWKSASRKL